MSNIPAAVVKRLTTAVPKFKKILAKAKERDVNESDTVTIITDMLEAVFGFDKYSEITREYGIQGTFCDLAIKTNKKIEYLIEVKAIGLELNGKHLKQAVNYASREGIKWVVLTNGMKWEIHRVSLDGKVQNERIFTIDFSEINPKNKEQQELLFLLCKRGVEKDLIGDYYEYRQSVNRYTIGAILLTDSISNAVRKELRKLKPGIKVDAEEIQKLIKTEVIKREVLGSDAGIEANKQVIKFMKKQAKAKAKPKVKAAVSKAEGQNAAE
ncbi:MAG: type I restriction enzyme HsdR N-terminal domain-containing protein [Sulfuriflexus sp.]|nr:type I restriction enzyme HsdR N-terminal domain-containing protein [Sulfuriflexus sp.]